MLPPPSAHCNCTMPLPGYDLTLRFKAPCWVGPPDLFPADHVWVRNRAPTAQVCSEEQGAQRYSSDGWTWVL
jgi:hypothetical protein